MKVLESFTSQYIDDVLRNTFSFPEDEILKYTVNKCKEMENIPILNVKAKGFDQQYILVKVSGSTETSLLQKNLKHTSLASPVFVMENNQKEVFRAFEKQQLEDFMLPIENHVQHLKSILKSLANCQASILVNSEALEKSSEYNIKDIAGSVLALNYFKTFNQTKIDGILDTLQTALNKLFKTSLLVSSIWTSSANNVYVSKHGNESIFLDLASKKILPPVCDALLYIFSLSDVTFRQQHFEDLVLYYFDSLRTSLKHSKTEIADRITRLQSERQVRILLPVIKFEQANSFRQSKNSKWFSEILTNISNYLEYPIINQEDVNEVLRNFLNSSDYQLLGYKLVALSEKNGHLGEYFHLNIELKKQNKKQELQLFAKFLIIDADVLRELVESGPGKKEDFFYKILYPLFAEHGLQSLLDFAPKCYLSRLSWLIVLDDLSKVGYTGLKPNAVLNYEGLSIVVAKLAKLHSSTLILEEMLSKKSGKKVRLNSEYGEYLEESMFFDDDSNVMKPMFDSTIKALQYVAQKFPDVTDKLNMSPEELKETLKNIFLHLLNQTTNSDKFRSVIHHGDMYIANILLKFGKEKAVDDAVLIDFQMLRYIPPAFELLFFIFSSSTKETRDKYLHKLLEEYYEHLSNIIKEFNFEPEEVFSRLMFDENVKIAKSASLSSAFYYNHLLHTEPDFREEVFRNHEKMKYYLEKNKEEYVDLSWCSEHYRNILKGLIEDFVELIKNDLLRN